MTTILSVGDKVLMRGGAVAAVQSCCCGGQGACVCTKGSLPDVVTVSFSGPQGAKLQSDGLLSLSFSSKCFGSGGGGTAEAPGGDKTVDGKNVVNGNTGAITKVTLTDGGKGYARYGREAPSLTFSNKSDVAATTEVSLAAHKDSCGLDYWSISSISVTDGGRGYEDGQTLAVSLGDGDSVDASAAGTIKAKRVAPSLTASPADGSSENLTVHVAKTDANPPTWEVTSVTVEESLGGYVEGQSVKFDGGGVATAADAEAYIRTTRSEPTLSLVIESDAGAGATLTPTLTKFDSAPFEGNTPTTLYAWRVSSVAIDSAGTGYEEGDVISASIEDGQEIENKYPGTGGYPFYGEVTDVDGSGGVTQVTVYEGGYYLKADDVAVRVDVWKGGEYYTGGVLDSVEIADGGKYYHENPSLTPYVADVDVAVHQSFPGDPVAGNHGTTTISATVEDDVNSEHFGEVKSLSLGAGGENWLGWYWVYGCDCSWVYGEGEGTDYQVPCYRLWNPETGEPTCEYVGFRCWADESCSFGPLLQLRASSLIKTEVLQEAVAQAPCGIPGEHGGPITGITGSKQGYTANLPYGWAIYGRVPVEANSLAARTAGAPEGGIPATCVMAELSYGGYAKYWSVESVSIGSPVSDTGLYDGQQVSIYSSEYPTTESVLAYEGEIGLDVLQHSPPNRTMVAHGTAEVDVEGNLTAVVITDGGVFYRRAHSTEEPALSPEVTVTLLQHKPSEGAGAAFDATVNTNTSSQDFGLLAISVSDGGDNYLAYTSGHNVFEGPSWFGGDWLRVRYLGSEEHPDVTATCGGPQESLPSGASPQHQVTYTSDSKIADCGQFAFDAYNGESKVSVAAGGADVFKGSNKCCAGCYVCCEDEPSQVVITLSRPESQEKCSTRGGVVRPLTFSQPVIELLPQGSGIGASLVANLKLIEDGDFAGAYAIASVSINDSGEGYLVGDAVGVLIVDGLLRGFGADISVATVSDDGGISGIEISDGGIFYNADITEDEECQIVCDADDAELVFDMHEVVSSDCGISVSRSASTQSPTGDDCPPTSETTQVGVTLGIFASDNIAQYRKCTQDTDIGIGGRMSVQISHDWSGSASPTVIGNAESHHIFAYRSYEVSAKCSEYSKWELNSNTKSAHGVNGRIIEVGDLYAHFEVPLLQPPDPEWKVPSYSLYRACPDYEVEIDFQQ